MGILHYIFVFFFGINVYTLEYEIYTGIRRSCGRWTLFGCCDPSQNATQGALSGRDFTFDRVSSGGDSLEVRKTVEKGRTFIGL